MPCAFRLRRFEREWLRAKPPHLRLMFNSAVRTLEPHWLAPDAGQGRVCGPRFTISLKRSTLIFSYPQAGRPITPSFGGKPENTCLFEIYRFRPASERCSLRSKLGDGGGPQANGAPRAGSSTYVARG